MICAKQPTKLEKIRLEHVLMDEVAGLKKNNRELAKLLAEKRNENILLKTIENNYHILESKFSIQQELHERSISNLETYFVEACSQLLGLVEHLTTLHKAIQKEKQRSRSSNEATINAEKDGTERNSSPLPRGHPLRKVSLGLNRLTSTIMTDSTESRTKTLREGIKKRHSTIEEAVSVSSNTKCQPSTKKFPAIESSSEWVCEESGNTFIASSYTGDNSLPSVTVMNSLHDESYNYLQDERFQNVSVDEETIVRKGTDQSTLSERGSPKRNRPTADKNTSQEKRLLEVGRHSDNEPHEVISQTEHFRKIYEDIPDEFRSLTHPQRTLHDSSELMKTVICEESDTSIGLSENCDSVTQKESTKETNVNYTLSVPSPDATLNSISQISEFSMKPPYSRNTEDSYASGSDTSYFVELDENPDSVSSRYFYFEPKNTQIYLRRYKSLLSSSLSGKLTRRKNKESCTGKENIHSTAHSKDSKQSTTQSTSSRKPLSDMRKETFTDTRNSEKSSFQNEYLEGEPSNRYCDSKSMTEDFRKGLNSPDRSGVLKHTRRTTKKRVPKIKKKIRSKKKENLRV